MTTNTSRKLLKNFLTKDETIEFKYFDTGSLSARFVTAGKTKNNADITFARINNIKDAASIKILPKLYKLIESVAHPLMDVTVEYNEKMHLAFLEELLKDRKLSPQLRWAIFVAGVSEVKEIVPEEIIAAGVAREAKLSDTIDTNAYRFFLRPDLGYFSQRQRTKVADIEALKTRQQEIADSLERPVFKLALERVEQGVVTANMVNLQKPTALYQGYSSALYGASMILTVEEIAVMSEMLVKNQVKNYFEDEPSMVVAYTYLTLGLERSEEFVQFLLKYTPAPEYYYSGSAVSFSGMNHPQGAVTFNNAIPVIDSLADDPSTPIEWAFELEL